MSDSVPAYQTLTPAVFSALKDLGGTARKKDIYSSLILREKYSKEVQEKLHPPKNEIAELYYRFGWSLNYLKKNAIAHNPKRGTWVLNAEYINADPNDIKVAVSPK